MNSSQYNRFTKELKENLLNYEKVSGLVAVGSMAEQDYMPDKWSDHDFSVIVETGYQEKFRKDLSWLPQFENIVLSFQETEHGLKVLYDNGHMIEFAVFDIEELYFLKINRYRILIDRENIKEHMEKIKKSTSQQSKLTYENNLLLGELITSLWIGIGRYKRGEKASAHELVKMSALKSLMTLIEKHSPSEHKVLIDNLDPLRRFEYIYPDLGEEIGNILLEPILKAARQMLNILERELTEHLEAGHKEAIHILQSYLSEG